MQTPAKMEFTEGAVKVTWCMCEHCAALGPHLVTVVRKHGGEQTQTLEPYCCESRRRQIRDDY
jgi:hypothetical protein